MKPLLLMIRNSYSNYFNPIIEVIMFEATSAIILTFVIIMIRSAIPTTILSVSVAEAGKEKDDNNGKDKDAPDYEYD
jgi:hypothetical protein